MNWSVKQGDILLESADVLICSANVFLNLSGGVGGEILRRFGDSMQTELREYLAAQGVRHVNRGDVVSTGSGGTNFRTVIHAVAVDGLYQTSIEVVSQVVRKSLHEASNRHAQKVALVALATGFGPLSMSDFGRSIRALKSEQFPLIEQIVVVVTSDDDVAEIKSGLNVE